MLHDISWQRPTAHSILSEEDDLSFTEAPDFDFDITMGTAGAKVLDALPMVKVGPPCRADSIERNGIDRHSGMAC